MVNEDLIYCETLKYCHTNREENHNFLLLFKSIVANFKEINKRYHNKNNNSTVG